MASKPGDGLALVPSNPASPANASDHRISPAFVPGFPLLGRLLDTIWFNSLPINVRHLGVFCLLRLSGFLCLLFGLFLGIGFSPLFGCCFLLSFEDSLPLFFELVVIFLNDRASNESDLIHLSDVCGLGRIFAFIIEPILIMRQHIVQPNVKLHLTSIDSSLALTFSFSSVLAKSAYWSSIFPLSS